MVKGMFNSQKTRLEDGQASCSKSVKACPCCSDEMYSLLLQRVDRIWVDQ